MPHPSLAHCNSNKNTTTHICQYLRGARTTPKACSQAAAAAAAIGQPKQSTSTTGDVDIHQWLVMLLPNHRPLGSHARPYTHILTDSDHDVDKSRCLSCFNSSFHKLQNVICLCLLARFEGCGSFDVALDYFGILPHQATPKWTVRHMR